jgi:polyhydroxybutyrate depolymerase
MNALRICIFKLGYVAGTPMPLVIAMHGGGGWGVQLQNQSQLSVKADVAGFIVVYPEGVRTPVTGIRTWNAGGCCGYAMNQNIDDVGFISALIDTLKANYSIDTNRIYATGMSNGAFLAYRLACELSNKIAAIAPVAGSMNVSSCMPTRGVPVIHFHSKLDTNVPYLGGVGSGASGHYNPPIDSVLNVLSGFSSCANQNNIVYSGLDYTYIRWSSCNCGNEMHLYLTEDGGHSWPGGRQTVLGDPVSTAINANDLMWTFFQQHTLNCITTGIESFDNNNKGYKIFPNPFSSQTTIQLNDNVIKATLAVYNIVGQKVKTIDNITGQTIMLDRQNLRNGVYFIRLTTESKIIISDKIIIND